jgi:hypothetical protein
MTGAVDPPPFAGQCGCPTAQPQAGTFVYYDNMSETGGLRNRLRNLLGMQPPASPYHQTPVVQVVPTAPPPVAVTPTAPPAATLDVITQRPEYQVPKKYEDKVGHEDDYSWITGHLIYVRADGGRWVLRYGLLDQVDKFGGSVVLAPTVELRNFREGDLVCVHGEVIDQGRASASLGGALYRVNSISMVERADP